MNASKGGKAAQDGAVGHPQPVRGEQSGQPASPSGVATATGVVADLMTLQRTAGNRAVSHLLSVRGGRPLERSVRAEMESRFGRSFRGVSVHTEREAATSARLL